MGPEWCGPSNSTSCSCSDLRSCHNACGDIPSIPVLAISAAENSCHCTCTKNNFVVSAGIHIITWRQCSKRRFWLKRSPSLPVLADQQWKVCDHPIQNNVWISNCFPFIEQVEFYATKVPKFHCSLFSSAITWRSCHWGKDHLPLCWSIFMILCSEWTVMSNQILSF